MNLPNGRKLDLKETAAAVADNTWTIFLGRLAIIVCAGFFLPVGFWVGGRYLDSIDSTTKIIAAGVDQNRDDITTLKGKFDKQIYIDDAQSKAIEKLSTRSELMEDRLNQLFRHAGGAQP